MNIKEMREKRAELVEKARKILQKAREEDRELTKEEESQWEQMHADADALKEKIDQEERQEEAEKDLERSIQEPHKPDPQEGENEEEQKRAYSLAFRNWLRFGISELEPEQRKILRTGFQNLSPEMRALGTPDSAGGYTIPEDFYNKLTDALKFYGGMRQSRAEIIRSTSGADLPMPTDDDTSNSGAILDENTQVGEQDITFGVVILGAYMYTSKLVRVSLQLLQDSAFDLESWLARKLGERIGRATNNHFTVGTGTAQPNGVVTAASEGKVGDTGQTTSVTYGDLVDLFHAVDRDYRQNGEWMMHDSSLKALKKLEDNDGRPLWQPGLAVREPDTILGKPYIVNNDVPVMGVDAKSILFGDFSLYKIRDVLGVQVLRLQERYADFLQVGFLAFSRHDGDLLDAGTAPIKYYQNSST
jgi:HK97 family phage major capsid protein